MPATAGSGSRYKRRKRSLPAVDREAALRSAIADCDRKLANYRALLDHDDAVTAEWIADTQRERKQLERQLGQHVPGDQLTPEKSRRS